MAKAQLGLMLEGQIGLNWPRWKRIVQVADESGYQCLFRSDHFTNPQPPHDDSLELWTSLTYAASHSKRIEFGPMVAPVTFRHPSMTARIAAAIDDLSDGRLVLGLGAGWQTEEHQRFGVPFYDFKTRFEMLEDALQMTRLLFDSDSPSEFQGKHFTLTDAVMLPRPQRKGGPPILIGGRGPKRTLPLVAKYASEWNAPVVPLDAWKEANAQLNELLAQQGRQSSDVKRSIMVNTTYGRTDAEYKALLQARGIDESRVDELIGRGLLIGTASMITDQISRFVEAGVQRFMLQWIQLDDIDRMEAFAREVLPYFHN